MVEWLSRMRGRPRRRWSDELVEEAGTGWMLDVGGEGARAMEAIDGRRSARSGQNG